ncbi:MAG: 50S ribosomal protein L23 [Phototrophicales bacterium]|nr:50S ribosomal protein L23 [Phototrophicales bacterium]
MPAIHLYEVLRRPIVTEKSNAVTEDLGKYTFEVALGANKPQIKEAIEVIFDVEVERVNTMVVPAKRGQRGRKQYIRAKSWKKAVVTLKPGNTIDLFNA